LHLVGNFNKLEDEDFSMVTAVSRNMGQGILISGSYSERNLENQF